jgi:hypothetical protein
MGHPNLQGVPGSQSFSPLEFLAWKEQAGNPMESSGCGSNGQTKDPNQNANQNGHLKRGKCDLSRWDDLYPGPELSCFQGPALARWTLPKAPAPQGQTFW